MFCRFLPGERRVVDKEHQLARTAEHDYDRYMFVPALTLSSTHSKHVAVKVSGSWQAGDMQAKSAGICHSHLLALMLEMVHVKVVFRRSVC